MQYNRIKRSICPGIYIHTHTDLFTQEIICAFYRCVFSGMQTAVCSSPSCLIQYKIKANANTACKVDSLAAYYSQLNYLMSLYL